MKCKNCRHKVVWDMEKCFNTNSLKYAFHSNRGKKLTTECYCGCKKPEPRVEKR